MAQELATASPTTTAASLAALRLQTRDDVDGDGRFLFVNETGKCNSNATEGRLVERFEGLG
jgi:hypothetical protein